MKLFSRTSLVALGTAAAITISGVTAPAFAQEDLGIDNTAEQPAAEGNSDSGVAANNLSLKQPELIEGKVGSEITPVVVKVTSGTATKFSASSLPAGLFIDNSGRIYGTPIKAFSGPVTVTATGPNSGEDTIDVNIHIKEVEQEKEEPSGSSDTDEISNWIKIITAVIGALTTILTFGTKLDSFLK
ncbi:hypothetical protein CS176_1586 [Corynebacterium glutamicum]|uniref:putative Ig domain-containing protein n=1 Tax=Corynebacterium glutamicum TaxID=1718 RepID=UPI00097A5BA0|nr:putative Ig domain-containing protein [Corynebacterium glutamicum]GAV97356.1 hypothetical protein CS176_1586 [Corynebacterium glutamicum]